MTECVLLPCGIVFLLIVTKKWSSLGELDQEESDTGDEDIEDVTWVKPVKRVRINFAVNNAFSLLSRDGPATRRSSNQWETVQIRMSLTRSVLSNYMRRLNSTLTS